MIARLCGTLIAKRPPQIIVDVAGIGYEVDCPMTTFCELPREGAQVTLLTHFVVREDAMQLFGFLTADERDAFRALIKISGVGPRIALALLSGMTPAALAQAVASSQTAELTRVPGIGKKTAERLILELKDKLHFAGSLATDAPTDARADVVAALLALGYSEKEAQAAAKGLAADVSVSEGIRLALRGLAH